MTHWKKAFDSPYLGSWDLEDYKELILTIDHVKMEVTKGLKENGLHNVAYFKEKKYKPMMLNATNCKIMKTLSGSYNIESWKNIRVTLYVLEGIKAFGGLHDGLRIREKIPTLPQLKKGDKKWNDAIKGIEAGTVSVEQILTYYKVEEKDLVELKKIKKK